MYVSGLDRMDKAGYVQYEISNASRPGRASRHNLKYWMDGEWLGFGCGAHSTRHGARWKNLSSTEAYITAIDARAPVAIDQRSLTTEDQLEEALFTGLRLNAGLDLHAVKDRYAVDVWERYGGALRPFVEQGILLYDGRSL